MSGQRRSDRIVAMPHYRLHHRHRPSECRSAHAAWRGWSSPLREAESVSSCHFGGHETWWDVESASEAEALALLPAFVAERTTAIRVERLRPSRAAQNF
jgi:hypothetical protein